MSSAQPTLCMSPPNSASKRVSVCLLAFLRSMFFQEAFLTPPNGVATHSLNITRTYVSAYVSPKEELYTVPLPSRYKFLKVRNSSGSLVMALNVGL